MSLDRKTDNLALVCMAIVTVIFCFIAFSADGTCDEGDSIYHYLHARYAIHHPALFFDHWAKPLYVLIMSPFAQLGLIGAKLANVLFSCVSIWFTYLIARKLQFKWALIIFPLSLVFRQLLIVTFSGLTEPLANMMLAIAIYLMLCDRYIVTAVIISFLPFVRSEGLFIAGVFGLYFVWMRRWQPLPVLLLGHIVYSIAGYPFYHDFLWVFHKIPYARLDHAYGQGTWYSFIEKMPYITGLADCILLSLGILSISFTLLYKGIKGQISGIHKPIAFLLILFLTFFFMHTAFWALGIFGSFGMIRVFVAVACVMILICAYGVETLSALLATITRYHTPILGGVLAILFFISAFSKSHYSYDWAYDFHLHADQICDLKAANAIKSHYPDYKQYHLFFEACYMSEVLDVDMFDQSKVKNHGQLQAGEGYPPKSIIVWDDWYSDQQYQLHLQTLRDNKSIKEQWTFQHDNPWGGTRTVVVFVRE